MSGQECRMISAYLDGELHGLRGEKFEAHLETCAACQAELAQLRSLSALLSEVPPLTPRLSPQQFSARLAARLPARAAPTARPVSSPWQKLARYAWQAIPLAVIAGWALLQTASMLGGLWGEVAGGAALPWLPLLAGVLPGRMHLLALFGAWEFPLQAAAGLGAGGLLLRMLSSQFMLLLFITLLFWSWLASWWVLRPTPSPARQPAG